jgi:hypothetical protein
MARDVMTIRLEQTFRARLQVAAKRRRVTPSAAARLAIEDWLHAEEGRASGRPWDDLRDLVGSVHGGDAGRSPRGRDWIATTRGRRATRRKK